MVASRESKVLAERMSAETIRKQNIGRADHPCRPGILDDVQAGLVQSVLALVTVLAFAAARPSARGPAAPAGSIDSSVTTGET
jgi:hypothetical protein